MRTAVRPDRIIEAWSNQGSVKSLRMRRAPGEGALHR